MRSAGDRLWIGIEGTTIHGDEGEHLASIAPGGIVLFRRNIAAAEQVRALCADLRARLGPELHIVVDQEGGAVVRFEEACTVFPGNLALGALDASDPEAGALLARAWGQVSGRELAALGLDGNLAPVVDLTVRTDNPGVGCRSFGGDPVRVGSLAAEFSRGHAEAGIFTVAKHFPGLGGADLDTHHALPRLLAAGVSRDLEPFARAIAGGMPAVMTAHAIHEGIDPEEPATASRAVVEGVLRERLGFGGVVMTDALEMGAVGSRPIEERVAAAIGAGHDVLCLCEGRAGWEDHRRARAELDCLGAGDDPLVSGRLAELPRRPTEEERARATAVDAERTATAIADGAVTVLRRGAAPVAVPPGERWLLLLPTLRDLTPAEDPLRAEDLLPFARDLGDGVQLQPVSGEPTAEEIAAAACASIDCDGIILATIGLPESAARRQLLLSALEWQERTIVIPLGDPGELACLPRHDFTALTAYGYRRPHQRALARVLRGEIEPRGRWPVAPEVARTAHVDL